MNADDDSGLRERLNQPPKPSAKPLLAGLAEGDVEVLAHSSSIPGVGGRGGLTVPRCHYQRLKHRVVASRLAPLA